MGYTWMWSWNYYNNFKAGMAVTPCGFTNELGNNTGLKPLVIPATKVNDSLTIPTKTFNI